MSKPEERILAIQERVIACRKCPRLVAWREQVAREKRRAFRQMEYWGKPVPGFGDPRGRVLVVGLAPAAHGGNRTGRVFTGDSSGDFLFSALHRSGFANQATARHRDDGLALRDIYIAAVCRCAPPGNKPSPDEISNCLPYLEEEIQIMERLQVIVVLGRIAFDNTLRIYRQQGYPVPKLAFGHSKVYKMGENLPWMVTSYHPSRQNTQTGRLTEAMFMDVWGKVRNLLPPAE